MDEYSDENLPQVGGPAISDYVKDIKVPDRFAMELDLKDIVGTLPDDQDTTPDIPQDLRDEYNQKMAEHGISTDDADYEGLTEEEKEILTDACKIFVIKGRDVHLVEGEVFNIKITYPYDLRVAETLIKGEDK